MTDLVLAPTTQPPVTPLDDLLARANVTARDSRAKSTQAAYERDWRSWSTFVAAHGFEPLVQHEETGAALVAAYIQHLMETGAKPATIKRRLAGVAHYHTEAGLAPPGRDHRVRRVAAGMRRQLGASQKKAPALLWSHLTQLIDALDPDTVEGRRDRALLLVGWYTAARRSELVSFDVGDIRFRADDAVLLLKASKTDQEQVGRMVLLPRRTDAYCPVAALEAWLEDLADQGLRKDRLPVFHGLGHPSRLRGRRILPGRLDPSVVHRVVKRAAAAAALAGDWSPHSLRAGFVTEAAKQGATAFQISQQTGHSVSGKQLEGYVRLNAPEMGNAAALLAN